MPVKVRSVDVLRQYFRGVVSRANDHAPNVNQVIYPLLGMITLSMDEESDIEVRGKDNSALGNILWAVIRGNRYAFRYEHEDDSIEIRRETHNGEILHRINNSTTVTDLRRIFESI